jgi:hypothetical protein
MLLIDKDLQIFEGKQIKRLRPFKRLRYFVYISVTINIILIVTLYKSCNQQPVVMERIIRDTVIKHHDITLTDSAILDELVAQKCVLPAVALAQFKIESSHFKSDICKENKNIAGIKTSRSKFVVGTNRGHCVYNTYRDCIKDYVRIQNRYLKSIEGKYAEAGGYVELIKNLR